MHDLARMCHEKMIGIPAMSFNSANSTQVVIAAEEPNYVPGVREVNGSVFSTSMCFECQKPKAHEERDKGDGILKAGEVINGRWVLVH